MKTLGFFLVLFSLVGGGFYLMASKFEVFEGVSIGNGEILAAEDWSKILVGKWKYRRVLRASFYSWVYEGEVEYQPDGKFTRFITCKYYEGGDGDIASYYLHIISGGSYSGKWSVSNSGMFFNEEIATCNVELGRLDSGYEDKSINFCQKDFAKGVVWSFGDIVFEDSKFELKRFDAEKIVIEGEMFSEGAKVEIVFTKEE